jgi:cytochrome b subunit of formate dehydrogenase
MPAGNFMLIRDLSIARYSTDYYDQLVAVQILPATLKIFLWSIVFLAAVYLVRRAIALPAFTEASRPAGTGYVERYEVGARLYHWGGVFILMAALAASGLALYSPGTMPAGPVSWLRFHELCAGLFIIGVLLHIGFSTLQGDPWSMWFDRHDWRDLLQMSGYLLGQTGDYPHFGKYDIVQKIYHLLLAALVAALIVSGSFLTLNAEVLMTLSHDSMRRQRLIHDASSFLIVGMIMMHAYLRLLKANWPTLVSMFTGTISLEYFRRHHDYERWSPPVLPDGEARGRHTVSDPAMRLRVGGEHGRRGS